MPDPTNSYPDHSLPTAEPAVPGGAGDPTPDALSLSAEHRMDAVCQRFEAAWRDSRMPRLADFLVGGGAERAALLRELILLDVEYRRCRGETPRLHEYREQFPAADADALADLFPVPGDTGPSTQFCCHLGVA